MYVFFNQRGYEVPAPSTSMMKHDETWGYWPILTRSISSWSSQIHPNPKSMLPEKTECSHKAPKNPWSCDRLWRNRPVLCRWASPVGAIHMHRDNINQGATQQQKKTRCYSWRLTELSKLWRSPCETRHWVWKDHERPSSSSFPRKALARSGERTSENAPPQGSWAAWDATQNQSATCVPPIYIYICILWTELSLFRICRLANCFEVLRTVSSVSIVHGRGTRSFLCLVGVLEPTWRWRIIPWNSTGGINTVSP